MRRLTALIDRQLDPREGPETLAVVRITTAMALLLTVGGVVARGADVYWRTPEHGGYRPDLKIPWLFDLLGLEPSAAIPGTIAVALAAGVFVLVGAGGRASAFVALQSYMALKTVNNHVGGSYEHLLTNALWLLVLAPATATWSVDCWFRLRRWASDTPVPVWCRRLFLLQLAVVYGSTGLSKVGTNWTPLGGFNALYWTLADTNWIRFEVPGLGWLSPLLMVATAVTWLFETGWILVPLWLLLRDPARTGTWARRARRLDPRPFLTAFGLALHLGIWVLMDVATFSWVVLAYYPSLWRPRELLGALARLRR